MGEHSRLLLLPLKPATVKMIILYFSLFSAILLRQKSRHALRQQRDKNSNYQNALRKSKSFRYKPTFSSAHLHSTPPLLHPTPLPILSLQFRCTTTTPSRGDTIRRRRRESRLIRWSGWRGWLRRMRWSSSASAHAACATPLSVSSAEWESTPRFTSWTRIQEGRTSSGH